MPGDGRSQWVRMAEDNPPGRVMNEIASAASDDRFRAIFERAGVGLVLIDEHCNISDTNQAFCDIVGRGAHEVLGTSCMAITHPDDVPENELIIERLADPNEQTATFEKRYMRPDGHTVWVRINLTKIPFDEGDRILAVVENVSDRKAAEAALLHSEQRLQRVLETDTVGVIFFNYEGVVVDANDAFLKMTGYSRAQVERRELDWRRMTPKEWVAASEEQMERLSATGRIGPYEKEYILADGSRRWMLFAGRDLGDGTIAEYCVDITIRKQTEEALRESEDRLRLAADAANIGTWDFNPVTGELRWDARCKRLFGLPPKAEVTYDIFLAGLHPEDRENIDQAVQEALRPGGTGEYDVQYRTIGLEDGIERWVAATGRAVFSGQGLDSQAARFIGTVIDISERMLAEQQLRDGTHNLEVLNRTGTAIAAELDLEHVVQTVTDAGVELTGAQFGAFFYNVVNPDGEAYMLYTLSGADRSQFDQFGMPRNTKVFAPTFAGDGIVRSDDITKDPRYGKNPPHTGMPKGHLPVVSYLAVPVTSRTGEVVGGLFFGHPEPGRFRERHERLMEGIAAQAAIAIDNARLFRDAQREIEQRVKVEEALTTLNETLESRVAEEIGRRAQAEEVLRQTQKMETVGQLSGGIAHDFNNLLQVIHGNLSILERALPQQEKKLRRTVANALSGTERAAALTKRLLAFSRRQPLDPRPVDVNRLILDMTDMLHRTLGETIVIETRLSADVPSALIDGNQLENAILNLAINARDAMPDGGHLEICTGVADLDRGYSETHPDATPGRHVRIEVRDTGHGMSEQVRNRAVEPFFSTKEVGEGTGLGLSMVYGFLRQSGGHLVLDSHEGAGTTVELYLPSSDSKAQARAKAGTVDELPRGKGERILLCEDDDDVRLFSSETLSELGYKVIEARDAGSALTALKRDGPVDLLFTDIVLPGGKTGAELARDARKLHPDLNVLFTTGYARSALDKEQRGQKGVEVLLKPFAVDELAVKIREMLSPEA